MNQKKYTIIGGGNGGHCVAGHLAIKGFDILLYDINQDTVDIINEQGGIHLVGDVEGFGKLKATVNIKEAIGYSDILMIVTPSLVHEQIAKNIAPYLRDNQIIMLHPGSTFGALAFNQELLKNGCEKEVSIVEASTLIYACRMIKPGTANIFGTKDRLQIGVFPSKNTEYVTRVLKEAYPQIESLENVLLTSLDNTNPIIHPPTTILNTSLIESGKEWLFYVEGVTDTVGMVIEELDKERVNMGKALGYDIDTIRDQYRVEYNACGETISEIFKKTKAYENFKGQSTLDTRYITEDIPMGLIPFISLAKVLNVETPKMESIVSMSEIILNRNLSNSTRTLDKLGLGNLSKEELLEFVETSKVKAY